MSAPIVGTTANDAHIEASKPRGPPKAYVTSMEDRLEKMEALLKRLRPEEDFSEELGPPIIRDSWKNDLEPCRQSLSPPSTLPSNLKTSSSGSLRPGSLPLLSDAFSSSLHAADTDLSSEGDTFSESEEVGELSLSRGMKRLTERGLVPAQEIPYAADSQVRFHGKSSWFKLIEPIRKLREEHVYSVTSGPDSNGFSQNNINQVNAAATRRREFWTTPAWELAYEGSYHRLQGLCRFLAQHFPPPDLADELIILFFDHINPQFPLFHRPTFERQWKSGLQTKDLSFGCLCLALFAVASRWCDDPRVLDENQQNIPEEERTDDERKWQRAGWKYFYIALDAHRESRSLFHPPGLFEVQTMSLMGMFIRGTAFHPVAWLFIGVGIRKAQDVGAHRKKVYGDKPSTEEELWKRAFWMLVLYDRIGSAALGRPCCSGEEDFDVDLPLEVDDEYWETEDPQKAFQQPPGKPAKVAAFNSYLRLTKIAAYALRKLYALDRSKLLISTTRPQLQDVLTQLNKALLEWIDSVPPHLHWSPSMEDPVFANQAATLYISYYLVQIIIYRPFLPPSLRSDSNRPPNSKMPVPCIAICVNAARCCSRILHAQVNRGISNIYSLICAAHMCAAILLMNYWDLKWQERNLVNDSTGEDIKSPLAIQMVQVLQEVKGFIRALELVRPRWRNAEIYLHVIFTHANHRNTD
ncbi:fungal-specific transcription factor domain-containing protein [Scleroderma citrinum]